METRNTFVRVKDHRHYNKVVVAYKKAGAKGNPLCFDKPAYVRCDEDKNLTSGGVATIKKVTKNHTELILHNGQLVPAVDPVDWTKRYAKVNNKAEYDAAIAAFVKLTAFKPHVNEESAPCYPGFVGVSASSMHKNRIASYDDRSSLVGENVPLTDLLKAARIDLSKPKLDREYKKGDKVRVTATPYPTYPYFSVGDVATLSRFDGRDWKAVFASGEEWFLQPSIGTRYEFFNESKPKDRRTRITYTEYPDGSREITKIENCLTREECEKVAPGYLDGTPCYYLDGKDIVLRDSREFRFRTNSKVLRDNVQDNAQIDSDYWPKIMRKAGERFMACKKAAAEKSKPKIVEVVI